MASVIIFSVIIFHGHRLSHNLFTNIALVIICIFSGWGPFRVSAFVDTVTGNAMFSSPVTKSMTSVRQS